MPLRLLTTCWAPAPLAKQPSVNSVSNIINMYQRDQVGSLFQVSKVTLQEKWLFGCLWLRSRIRAHNKRSEAEQLLSLFQYIFLFARYRFPSKNAQCKLNSMKVSAELCLDRTNFLVVAHRKQPIFAFSTHGTGKEGQKSSGLSLSTFSGFLWWLPQGLASSSSILFLH